MFCQICEKEIKPDYIESMSSGGFIYKKYICPKHNITLKTEYLNPITRKGEKIGWQSLAEILKERNLTN